MHLFSLQQTCQLQWALTQLSPRFTSLRLHNIFMAKAIEAAEAGITQPDDFHFIMQGHRNRRSKYLYMKMRQTLINNKESLAPEPTD